VIGLANLKELASASVLLLVVTPEAPKHIEHVMGLALALGPARTTAQNAAAPIMIGIFLFLRSLSSG
jgi:hypothetical protein